MSHPIEIKVSDWSVRFGRMNSNKAEDEGSKEKWLTQKKMFSERILFFSGLSPYENSSNLVPPIKITDSTCTSVYILNKRFKCVYF